MDPMVFVVVFGIAIGAMIWFGRLALIMLDGQHRNVLCRLEVLSRRIDRLAEQAELDTSS